MDELDLVYKAFKDYRNQIKNEVNINSFKNDLKGKATVLEKLESVSTTCVIDNTWVDEIDLCMPYVIKAVMEERQFVKSEGEVLPIDRIKTVGKDTVEDLAKHSNYITQQPEPGEKLIPDKLLMARKEADYAIYENRFLYTLLIYLTQFIEIRLNEILALTGKYEAKTSIIKKENNSKRILDFNLDFYEKRFNDPITRRGNGSQEAIDKLQSYLIQARSLLMTPVMKEVSQKPKVTFPIVKTNVLKFNTNFKNAVRLFEFLHAYKGKGFKTVVTTKNLSPFTQALSEQFSEVIYLSSFITYILTNDFEKNLHKEYEENEKKKKQDENDRYLKELKKIQKNLKQANITPIQYIQKLEKANSILEQKITQKELEFENMKQDMDVLRSDFNLELKKALEEQREKDTTDFKKVKEDLENDKIELNNHILEVEKEREMAYEDAKNQIDQMLVDNQNKIKKVSDQYDAKIAEYDKKIAKMKEVALTVQAELNGLREMYDLPIVVDFTNRTDFEILEKEKIAFDNLFARTWKDTKKKIRSTILKGNKNESKER